MRVTAFAPHPDDELIGCGGSLRNWVRAGAEVSVVYLTSGDLPTHGRSRSDNLALREAEAAAGLELLGIRDHTFLREPDGALLSSPDLTDALVAAIRRRRPHVVYVPHARDGHPDHVATHSIVTRAVADAASDWLYEAAGEPWEVETLLAYEVWTPIEQPNYFEDTTDVIGEQVAALEHHQSQVERTPYDAFVRGLGAYRGARLGHGRFAEAFEVLSLRRLPSAAPRFPDGRGDRDALLTTSHPKK